MRKLGLGVRLLIATALLVLSTVGVSACAQVVLARINATFGATLQGDDEAAGATALAGTALQREDAAAVSAILGGAVEARGLAVARGSVDGALTALDALSAAHPEHEEIGGLREAVAAYRGAVDRVIAALAGGDAVGLFLSSRRELNPLLLAAVGAAKHARDEHFEAQTRVVKRARDDAAQARMVMLGLTGAAAVVWVALALHVGRRVVRPIGALTAAARAIARGDLDQRVDVGGDDELGELAAAFNHMAAELAAFKRANVAELRTAELTLEAGMEAMPDGVVLLDGDRQVLSMNRAGKALLRSIDGGKAAACDFALGTRPLEEVLDATEEAEVAAAAEEEAGGGGGGRGEVADLTKAWRVERGGVTRRIVGRSVAVGGLAAGEAVRILVLYDVTDLAKLDELRMMLLAFASHEARTLLEVIVGALGAVEEAAEEDRAGIKEETRAMVRSAGTAASELAEMVDGFLDLTQVEAGELRLNFAAVGVREFVGDLTRRWARRAAEAGVRIEVRVAERARGVAMRADAGWLGAAVDNVVGNAIKYSPRGETVVVAVDVTGEGEREERRVVIAVSDRGRGIPAAYQGRVFELFFRVEEAVAELGALVEVTAEETDVGTRRGRRGVGMGLYLCAQIVEAHRGTARCEDGEDGRGTRMVIEVPIAGAGGRGRSGTGVAGRG